MSKDVAGSQKRHHAVIAGTGRAGTTFLVQFLGACGVDIGGTSEFDERANAGLEIPLLDPRAPYLAKDPWLFTYCESLDLSEIHVDVVILPMREMAEAVTSRLVQEKSRVIEVMPDHFAWADAYGVVPGGSVYSLEPLDLERILATGFYRVLRWAVAHEIPVVLLDFPRLVNDGDYLISNLWPWISKFCSRNQAEHAFAATARSEKVTTSSSGEPGLSPADFRAMQLVVRDLQREVARGREEQQLLRLAAEKLRLEKISMESSRVWRLASGIRKLIRRAP